MELTDKELAVRSWKRKNTVQKFQAIKKAGLPQPTTDLKRLSDDYIYWIWKKNQTIDGK